jgi:hypothetical protein
MWLAIEDLLDTRLKHPPESDMIVGMISLNSCIRSKESKRCCPKVITRYLVQIPTTFLNAS